MAGYRESDRNQRGVLSPTTHAREVTVVAEVEGVKVTKHLPVSPWPSLPGAIRNGVPVAVNCVVVVVVVRIRSMRSVSRFSSDLVGN
jgi:hypothetical protein